MESDLIEAHRRLQELLGGQSSAPTRGIVGAVSVEQRTCTVQVDTEVLHDIPYYGPVTPVSGMEAVVLFRDGQSSRPAAIAFRSATPALMVLPTGQVQIGPVGDTLGMIIADLLTALETATAGGDPLSTAAAITALKARTAAALA